MSTSESKPQPPRYALGLVLVVFLGVPVAYVAWGLATTMLRYDYNVLDMDWNNDGWITPGEVLDSLDVATTGPRTVCREFYSLKDGRPIRTECPKEVRE